MEIVALFVVWIAIAIVGAIVAGNKGFNASAWFVGCLLLPLAILILLALPPRARPGGTTKTCPQCAQTVMAAAKLCRFCGYEFPAEGNQGDLDHAAACYNRGVAYLGKKDYDQAVAAFSEAIRLDPKYVTALKARANAYRARKDDDRATFDLNKANALMSSGDGPLR